MGDFSNVTPEQIIGMTNALTLALLEGRSVQEINVLGELLITVGSLMMTVAAQQTLLEVENEKDKK
ncbi:MAG: hypothetical protein ACRC2K_07990 [Clostridium sp.]